MHGHALDLQGNESIAIALRRSCYVLLLQSFYYTRSSDGIGDDGIAGDGLGFSWQLLQAGFGKCAFDITMHVAESQVYIQHFLPYAAQPKMPGLDDPSVHRTHWYLKDALAFDLDPLRQGITSNQAKDPREPGLVVTSLRPSARQAFVYGQTT